MHRIFFSVKRVHLRIVEVSKILVRRFELTPARFDLMRIVFLHGEHGVLQTKIRALLGVSKTTVSRMLVALEELGFVERRRWPRDKRELLVTLTDVGWGRLDEALLELVEIGRSNRMAKRGAAFEGTAAVPLLRALQRTLNSMRRVYGDASPFVDPWRTDDLVPYYYTTVVDGRIQYGADVVVPRPKYDEPDGSDLFGV